LTYVKKNVRNISMPNETIKVEDLMSRAQACSLLEVTRQRIEQLVRAGELTERIEAGGLRFFHRRDVERYKRERDERKNNG
jgi:excisionase family DNA binding protein